MKKKLSTFFLLACCIFYMNTANARNYYLNSRIGSDKNNGSSMSPLKSLEHLNEIQFRPGDKILFSKGCTFSGAFSMKASGSPEKPIIIAAYGTGDKPVLSNPSESEFNGNVIQIVGKYIVIRNLTFRKPNLYEQNNYSQGRAINFKEFYLKGAVFQLASSSYLDITDCIFRECPVGLNLNGMHNLVARNSFEASLNDLHSVNPRTSDSPVAKEQITDDQNAKDQIAIVLGSSFYEIVNNKCLNFTNEKGEIGVQGGFLAIDSIHAAGPIEHIRVVNNYLRTASSKPNRDFSSAKKVHSLY